MKVIKEFIEAIVVLPFYIVFFGGFIFGVYAISIYIISSAVLLLN